MFGKFFKKADDIFPEAIIAASWWSSKLLDKRVAFYNGPICYCLDKKKIPSENSVAVFESNLRKAINLRLHYIVDSFPYSLSISSSDTELIRIAEKANIDDFESHFGRGAMMYIDFDGVCVYENGKHGVSHLGK